MSRLMITFDMNYEEQTYSAGWIAAAVAWTIIAALKLASVYLSRTPGGEETDRF